jgi:hypothetical protein
VPGPSLRRVVLNLLNLLIIQNVDDTEIISVEIPAPEISGKS